MNKFYDYPISMKMQTFKNMGFARTMKAGFSYLKSAMFKLPETSLENFYINRFGRVLYSMFFEGYTEKLWGRHPREISADWGAQRVKGLSIRALIKDMFKKAFGKKDNDRKHVETSLIEQFWYPKYGPGQFWEQVADEVTAKGGSVLLEHCVKQIICEEDNIVSVVCDTPEGEKTFTGDVFISTMPLKDLVLGMKGGRQSDEITAIAAGLPYRDFVTVGLLVERMNLKNETDIKTLGNIVPDCWIYVQETNVKLGRIQIFNNWSPYMVKDPEHTVWIGMEYFCNENDDFWNMSDDECVAYAAAELELKENIEELDLISEYHLSKEPIRIDLLIIKEENAEKVMKNEIGHIMRKYNVLEYKGPGDELSIDTLYKTLGYACLYKGYGKTIDEIPADELTVSLFREAYPRELFLELERKGYVLEEKYPGIYYVRGNILFPVQIVVISRLNRTMHSSLRILSANADIEDIRKFLEQTENMKTPRERNNIDAVLQASVSAN